MDELKRLKNERADLPTLSLRTKAERTRIASMLNHRKRFYIVLDGLTLYVDKGGYTWAKDGRHWNESRGHIKTLFRKRKVNL